jgi:hypothetical protein
MGVTVLTECQTKDVQVERGSEDLAVGLSRTAVTRVDRRETRMEYTTREWVWWFGPQNHRWRVYGFGPQNPGGGSEEKQTARGGIEKFALRRSYLMKDAMTVG